MAVWTSLWPNLSFPLPCLDLPCLTLLSGAEASSSSAPGPFGNLPSPEAKDLKDPPVELSLEVRQTNDLKVSDKSDKVTTWTQSDLSDTGKNNWLSLSRLWQHRENQWWCHAWTTTSESWSPGRKTASGTSATVALISSACSSLSSLSHLFHIFLIPSFRLYTLHIRTLWSKPWTQEHRAKFARHHRAWLRFDAYSRVPGQTSMHLAIHFSCFFCSLTYLEGAKVLKVFLSWQLWTTQQMVC